MELGGAGTGLGGGPGRRLGGDKVGIGTPPAAGLEAGGRRAGTGVLPTGPRTSPRPRSCEFFGLGSRPPSESAGVPVRDDESRPFSLMYESSSRRAADVALRECLRGWPLAEPSAPPLAWRMSRTWMRLALACELTPGGTAVREPLRWRCTSRCAKELCPSLSLLLVVRRGAPMTARSCSSSSGSGSGFSMSSSTVSTPAMAFCLAEASWFLSRVSELFM
mmetsp:Transcript_5586/g.13757  ORF Transcript_5586/g.13757 Transcript_5586/m.13757 type:complete len:220 (-) Transcript_5586:486-1145(-)